jgi:hypothetical protein
MSFWKSCAGLSPTRPKRWLTVGPPTGPTSQDLMLEQLREGAKSDAEIARLRAALEKANSQAEHFEREWYLRGDEIEKMKEAYAEACATLQES